MSFWPAGVFEKKIYSPTIKLTKILFFWTFGFNILTAGF
jgi:hypothetical protein